MRDLLRTAGLPAAARSARRCRCSATRRCCSPSACGPRTSPAPTRWPAASSPRSGCRRCWHPWAAWSSTGSAAASVMIVVDLATAVRPCWACSSCTTAATSGSSTLVAADLRRVADHVPVGPLRAAAHDASGRRARPGQRLAVHRARGTAPDRPGRRSRSLRVARRQVHRPARRRDLRHLRRCPARHAHRRSQNPNARMANRSPPSCRPASSTSAGRPSCAPPWSSSSRRCWRSAWPSRSSSPWSTRGCTSRSTFLGILQSAMGVGAIARRRAHHRADPRAPGSCGRSPSASAWSPPGRRCRWCPSAWVVALAMVLIGAGLPITVVCITTMLQRHTPSRDPGPGVHDLRDADRRAAGRRRSRSAPRWWRSSTSGCCSP